MSEEVFYEDPHFWVAVAFVAFVLMIFRPAAKYLTRTLDARSAQIASDLAEARRLREEAQSLLDSYRRKQQESLKEAEALLEQAKKDAASMAAQAEAELKTALDKRMKLASDRIAQAETKALQDVQNHVVDIAIAAARSLVKEQLNRTGGKELITQAAAELERKLH